MAEQRVEDDIAITRFGSFTKINASIAWNASARWGLFSRLENVLNRRDLGFERTVISAAGGAQRISGIQRDPGTVISAGLNLQF